MAFPLAWLVVATLGTAGVLGWLGWNTAEAYQTLQVIRTRDLRITELSGVITHLDEVLTMSARMAAATGNSAWEARYRHFEPILDAAIKEVMTLAPEARSEEAAAQTDAANLYLMELEHQSFEAVRQGRLKDAQTVLFSDDYETHKQIYADGLHRLTDFLKARVEAAFTADQQRASRALHLSVSAIVLLLGAWLVLWRTHHRWQRFLKGHQAQLVQYATQLREANQALDQKVAERTAALTQTNAELTHQQGAMRSLLEDLQTSKENLESQQRRLEHSLRELQESQLQLVQAAKMESVGRLAAGVAHEVKNPLAILLMGAEYLAQHVTDGGEKTQAILQDMTHAVKRADTVIQGLLDFSVSRKLALMTESLNALIEEALLLVKHEILKFHVTVVTHLASPLPLLKLDRQKIEQVFVNLFMNAIHAMPGGGTLTVRTAVRRLTSPLSHDAPSAVVDVEDTGTGIPEDSLAKIFDPFFTTKPPGQGTGLGLTVAKKIVELHHGTIEIRNRPEGGARATVRLPLGGRA